MGMLRLVPWGQTTWSAEGRLASRTPMPLTEKGRAVVGDWADELVARDVRNVYYGSEQTGRETAQIVAQWCGAKLKAVAELREVDVGLWEGLNPEMLRKRFPKAHKRWQQDPSAVCPPKGEGVDSAATRLRRAIDKITRKETTRTAAVVLGPIAIRVVRCLTESADLTKMWSMENDRPRAYELAVES